MIWIKAVGYLVGVSIALCSHHQRPRHEYTQAEKVLLTELCATVTLDYLLKEKTSREEPCFFSHGDHQGKLIPFQDSLLKRIKKQGCNAYPSTAMVGKGDFDFLISQRDQQKPMYVLEGTNREGRLYIVKFKSYEADTVHFTVSRLKRNRDLSSCSYQLKKTGTEWVIESRSPIIY